MRNLILYFLFLAISGCSIYDAEKYIYKKSQAEAGVVVSRTEWGEAEYEKGAYKFFPRFYTLTRSYSNPDSLIVISSSKFDSIYLKKIKIVSSTGSHEDEIVYEKEVDLSKRKEEESISYIALKLFSSENTDLTKYWLDGDIKVIVSFINGNGKDDAIHCDFKLWKGKDIAWPT